MIESVHRVNGNLLVLVVYSLSEELDLFIRKAFREALYVHKDFVLTADSARETERQKSLTISPPLLGERWLLHVDADMLNVRELRSLLGKNTVSAVTVFWTKKYRTYMQIIESRQFKALGVYARKYSFSRVSPQDIFYLYEEMVHTDTYELDRELLKFLATSYTFNVPAVMSLFKMLNSGEKFETKQKIIERIGIGGNTTDTLVLSLLKKRTFNTEKARKKFYRDCIKRLRDLAYRYSYRAIYNFMMHTLEGIMIMKQLQLEGVYGRAGVPVPEWVDTDVLNRVRRFDRALFSDVSLASVLNLRKILTDFNDHDTEVGLLCALGVYIDAIPYSIEYHAAGRKEPVSTFRYKARRF